MILKPATGQDSQPVTTPSTPRVYFGGKERMAYAATKRVRQGTLLGMVNKVSVINNIDNQLDATITAY